MSENKYLCGKIFCPFGENNECITEVMQEKYKKEGYYSLLAGYNKYVGEGKSSGEIVCKKQAKADSKNTH